jgi:hypothetical protein
MDNKKLGIIVPYRERRTHLKEFIRRTKLFLEERNFNYQIIVVNQDNAKLFNRGMLLNIGFVYAKKLKCDYVVFHDVDMIPEQVDYSYCEHPLHLATGFVENKNNKDKNSELFDQYFGGVTMFTIEDFTKIDGFSNKYWGWGYEDTDLLFRCKKHSINLNKFKIKNKGKPKLNLSFNGVDSYVEGKNIINFNKNFTLHVSFYSDKIRCNPSNDIDDYNIFTLPGYDFAISYNSFSRYNFCFFDNEKNALYVNTNIKTNYKTNITVIYDATNKTVEVYQDGIFVGITEKINKVYPYEKNPNFYLGVSNPYSKDTKINKNSTKFYKGYIDSLVIFDKKLNSNEVLEISNIENTLLTNDFGDYVSSNSIILYYDTEHIEDYQLIDLSKNGNNGTIYNCEIAQLDYNEYKIIKIPHRRKSLFSLLNHTNNGFHKNKWKTQATRWNQLRFFNEVVPNNLIKNDGLSTLEFTEYGKRKIEDKILHINVGL